MQRDAARDHAPPRPVSRCKRGSPPRDLCVTACDCDSQLHPWFALQLRILSNAQPAASMLLVVARGSSGELSW
jgi:hypothetical protein